MEENKQTPELGEAVVQKGRFRTWFENFWYHYKWHSIVALFLVFTISICTLQMCQRIDYDIHIVYAGQKQIGKTTTDGNFAEAEILLSSFKGVTDDFNENGSVDVALFDLFMLSSEEISEIESDKDKEVNYALLQNNNKTFRETIMYSNYYIYLLSDSLYEEYRTTSDGLTVFEPLAPYADGKDLCYYDDSAVYLHKSGLDFAKLPGVSDLPENTVICLRRLNVLASHFDEKENEEMHRRGVSVLENILETAK